MLSFRSRAPKFRPPVAGSKVLFLGNSKPDTAGGLGQWCDTIAAYFGWIPVNRNQISNGGFELTGTAGWQGVGTGATIARVTGAGNTHNSSAGAGQLFYTGGTPGQVMASPYNPVATSWGVDTAADIGGMRMGMVGGTTYTFSAWLMTPGSGASQAPAGSFFVSAYTRIGAGSYVQTSGNTVANDGAFHQSTVTFAVPLGATEAFVRILFVATNATAYVLFDDCQLERQPSTSTTPTTYMDYYTRGAISGSLLQNNDAAAVGFSAPYNTIRSDLYDTLAARVYSTAADIIFLQDNMNDLYYTAGAGATTPTSAATWRTCLVAIMAAMVTNMPNAKIVMLGASNTVFPFPGGARTFTVVPGSGYTNGTYTLAGNGSSNVTVVVSGGQIVSATPVTPGWNYAVGTAITLTGMGAGTGGSVSVASLVNQYAFGAGSLDQAVGIMDEISAEICGQYPNVLFVPVYSYMDRAYASPLANDGKHPSRPYGMDVMASIVIDALSRGGY